MHLADTFIQSDLHCIQVTVFFFYILSALSFPGNQTHDLGVASAMLYHLSYRKAQSSLIVLVMVISLVIVLVMIIILVIVLVTVVILVIVLVTVVILVIVLLWLYL